MMMSGCFSVVGRGVLKGSEETTTFNLCKEDWNMAFYSATTG